VCTRSEELSWASFDRSIFNPSPDGTAREQRDSSRDGGTTNRPFLPLRPRPRSCSIAAAERRSGGAPKEGSPQPTRGITGRARGLAAGSFCSRIFCLVRLLNRIPPFFPHRSPFLARLSIGKLSSYRATWRARRSSSFTCRRRSSENGRASGSSSGTPRRDSS